MADGSNDTPFWGQPDGRWADDLTLPQPGGGSYAGIPQGLNGIFTEKADAPEPSVPAALRPAEQMLCGGAAVPEPFQPKDSD